jgi:site-specific DNA recombinase
MNPLSGLRVGLYTRISEDTEADAKGVKRQEADERAEVARQGGTAVAVYEENDTSAYKRKRVQRTDDAGNSYFVYRVVRPEYQRLLADLRSGALDAAIVYDLDRLARDPRDLEDAIEVVQHYRRPIVGVTGGVDLLSDHGQAMARVLVAMANKSSADTARRVTRKHHENAENGVPVGGTRPFGWQDDKRTLLASEAGLIREAVDRVLGGTPVSAVVTDWNGRGIRTPRGNEWRPKALRLVLTNPRICGYSARNRSDPITGQPVLTIVRRPDGTPVTGLWQKILEPDVWEALCATLAPKTRRPGGSAHKYLLSGIARCGKCTAPLRGIPRQRKDTVTYAYLCHSRANGGCGGVSRNGPQVDELIKEIVLGLHERQAPAATASVETAWLGEEDLKRVTRLINEQTDAWRAGLISGEKHFAELPELEQEQRRLRAERAAHLAQAAAQQMAPADVRQAWEDDYGLTEKRAAVLQVLTAVVIHPVTDRRQAFDPGLVQPIRRAES